MKDKTTPPNDYTTTEVAALLGISPRAVRQHLDAGHFPNARKLPGFTTTYLIPRADVKAFLQKKRRQLKTG